MEINTKNSSGMMNGLPPTPKDERRVGPIVGALVVILVIIIAALFFFGQRLNTQNTNTPESNPQVSESATVQNNVIRNEAGISTSTEVHDLQTDLDKQLNDIDYSF